MWFLFLDEDPLLCQATLGYSSAAHGRRLPLTDTTPAVRHKMDAIRMINERLPDVKKATSVGTMIGVAVLANVEVSLNACGMEKLMLILIFAIETDG